MVFVFPVITLITLTYNLIKDLKIAKTRKKRMTLKESSGSHTAGHAHEAGHTSKINQSNKPQGPSGGSQQTLDNITPAFVCVVVVFIVCQVFNPIRRLLMFLVPPGQQKCWSFFSLFSPFSGTAVLVNSAGNFFIFVLVAKGFRRQVMMWFR